MFISCIQPKICDFYWHSLQVKQFQTLNYFYRLPIVPAALLLAEEDSGLCPTHFLCSNWPPGGKMGYWRSQNTVLNGPILASFSFIFVFSDKYYSFYNICEKMSINFTNPRYSGQESPPITTRPGLQPVWKYFRYLRNL